MKSIKKINKNYYKIFVEPVCSVLLDEELMKKAVKILYEYKQKIDGLLQNNPQHLIKEEWSLVYSKGKQKVFYGTDLKPVKNASAPMFGVKKVDNLYFIGDENIYSNKVKKEIKKLIETYENL